MFMEYVLFFYMLGLGLVAYIFHQLNEKSKGVSRIEVERNEDQCKHKKVYIPDPKDK